MFRFNNPDALLVLLLTVAAYALVRAVEDGSTRWLIGVGVLVGFGFLTKQLQALLVVPGFALVYLVAAPGPVRRRIGQLLAAGAAMVAAAGWWIATVELVPAGLRPYVGGSQGNSILELTLGYNGLGRLTGNETGSVGGGGQGGPGGGPGGGGWGETGLTRLFNAEMGGQIAWLLPAALVALGVGVWLTWGRSRTDRQRAAFGVWGSWLVVTGLVFSLMQGIFHAYYNIALAPAVAATVAMGASMLWARRERLLPAAVLATGVAGTALWAFVLLGRSADWFPWLRTVVLFSGLSAALLILAGTTLASRLTDIRFPARMAAVVAAAALVAVLTGPAAYAVQTAATPHGGSIVSAGPAVAGAMGGPGGGPGGQRRRFNGGPGGFPGGPGGGTAQAPQAAPGGFGQMPGGPGGAPQGGPGGMGGRGGMGGLLNGSTASAAMKALLLQDAERYDWVAAAIGANSAAGYQLATEKPVMPIGGFNGSDPSPTLAQFQRYVAEGRIHWFIGGGMGMRSDSGSSASAEIAAWVQANFQARTVDGATVYDLTS
jgi:4-amino-4-deoxy-L-arabinose transferase-like glycosyltransferase